jgi:hypothetical protein
MKTSEVTSLVFQVSTLLPRFAQYPSERPLSQPPLATQCRLGRCPLLANRLMFPYAKPTERAEVKGVRLSVGHSIA